MNTQISTSPLIGVYVWFFNLLSCLLFLEYQLIVFWGVCVNSCVTFGLMAAALIPMLLLVNTTPDKIPADELMEEEQQQGVAAQDMKEKEDTGEKEEDISVFVSPAH